jgi:hypothetical protein
MNPYNFIKENKIGFILGGVLGAIMPFIFFILWGLGLHQDTYSSILDYLFLLGYIIPNKFIPQIQVGLINIKTIICLVFNVLYLGFVGLVFEKIIKRKTFIFGLL